MYPFCDEITRLLLRETRRRRFSDDERTVVISDARAFRFHGGFMESRRELQTRVVSKDSASKEAMESDNSSIDRSSSSSSSKDDFSSIVRDFYFVLLNGTM